jgi:hypothetical protein
LAKEEFSNETLPERVSELQKFGVEIRFCDNLLAHKKYYYALQEFPDAFVITFDDDFFYEKRMLENLMKLKLEYPNHVVTNRAHLMQFDSNELKPYRQWNHNTTVTKPGHQVFATGGVGTLYESSFYSDSLFDKSLIQKISPKADDVWLKFMTYLNGIKVVTNKRYNKDFITLPESQKEQLIKSNVQAGGNDIQIQNAIKLFNIDPLEFNDIDNG